MTTYLTDKSFVGIYDKDNNQLMKLVIGFILFCEEDVTPWVIVSILHGGPIELIKKKT